MPDPRVIIDFWFEGLTDDRPVQPNRPPAQKWFKYDPQFDEEIRRRFEADLIEAGQGRRVDWEKTPEGRLALILMFDQFSRNLYRGTPQMYVHDPPALRLAQRIIDGRLDRPYPLVRRAFLYMPLMHAEDPDCQQRCVDLFQELVAESRERSPANVAYYEYQLGYAMRYQDVIRRFGRFPHRNRILNRSATPQEQDFLKTSKHDPIGK